MDATSIEAEIEPSQPILNEISPEDYPGEVKRCIIELRRQRERIIEEMSKIDCEKKRLQSDIRTLTDRLAKISVDQAQKMQYRIELEKTIHETEIAYAKLIETSKGLYKVVNDTKRNMPVRDSRIDVKSTVPGTEDIVSVAASSQ